MEGFILWLQQKSPLGPKCDQRGFCQTNRLTDEWTDGWTTWVKELDLLCSYMLEDYKV